MSSLQSSSAFVPSLECVQQPHCALRFVIEATAWQDYAGYY